MINFKYGNYKRRVDWDELTLLTKWCKSRFVILRWKHFLTSNFNYLVPDNFLCEHWVLIRMKMELTLVNFHILKTFLNNPSPESELKTVPLGRHLIYLLKEMDVYITWRDGWRKRGCQITNSFSFCKLKFPQGDLYLVRSETGCLQQKDSLLVELNDGCQVICS